MIARKPAPGERTILPASVRCRACSASGMEVFARSSAVPVNNARVFQRADEARMLGSGELEMAFCSACGFVENTRYRRALVTYDSSYEEQQTFSPTFNAFADDLARGIVRRWDLHRKRVVEIGCGKGDFLAAVCALGENQGVGIDPTAVPGRLTGPGSERVRFIVDLFPRACRMIDADAVLCRHTLEHISDVARFVRTLRRALVGRPDARVFIEVPDVLRVLREGAFWDVYYEHCSYFTPGSLARLFRRCGFAIDDVRLGFDDQYILLEARPSTVTALAAPLPGEETPSSVAEAVDAYQRRVAEVVERWRERVNATRAAGGRVAVWGSGSKCVAFLSETGLAREIDAVVDINPHRHGHYLPLTAKRIDPPASLAQLQPALVIIMNPIYRQEISTALDAMGVGASVEAV